MTKEEQQYVKTLQNPYASLNFDSDSDEISNGYELGTFFKVLDDDQCDLCILAQVAPYSIALINLRTGNRLVESIEVQSLHQIPKEVIKRLAASDDFEVMPVSWQFV